MDMLRQLNDSINYIEANLSGNVDPGEAARIACVSVDSYLRFFSYMAGMSLAKYVRLRRLSLAAEDLLKSGDRIIDIALRWGWDSPDAFSRTFIHQHGIAPSALRRSKGSIRILPPVSFSITLHGGREMNYRLMDVPDLILYGCSRAYDPSKHLNHESLRGSMWEYKSENIPGQICSGGWNHPFDPSYDGLWYGLWRNGRYLIGRVKDDVCSDQLERQIVPAGRYAVFTSERGAQAWEALPAMMDSIFQSWLPSSGYQLRSDDVLEIYHLWTDRTLRQKQRYYEVCIPITEAER